MRILSLFATTVIASTALTAQSPLVTTYANNNNGGVGGGVYFDLTVSVPIVLNLVEANVSGIGSVDVLICPNTSVGNETNAGAWTQIGSGSVNGSAGVPTPLVGFLPVPLAPGSYGVAFRAVGVSHYYTNGTGANQVYSTNELTLTAGTASNVAFVGPLFSRASSTARSATPLAAEVALSQSDRTTALAATTSRPPTTRTSRPARSTSAARAAPSSSTGTCRPATAATR